MSSAVSHDSAMLGKKAQAQPMTIASHARRGSSSGAGSQPSTLSSKLAGAAAIDAEAQAASPPLAFSFLA